MRTHIENIPCDERKITDDDFFQALDLSWSGLGKAAEAYRKGDVPDAKRLVVEYFQTRKHPIWIWDLRGASQKAVIQEWIGDPEKLEAIILSADEMLNNRFTVINGLFEPVKGIEFDFGSNLNWNVPELQGHNTLSEWFKRLQFLECLAIAYLITKTEAYITKYVEALDKYLTEWPLVWENKDPDAYFIQKHPIQEAMSTGYRTLLWIRLLYTDVPYDQHVPPELTFRMIRSIWFTAWQYRRFDTDHLPQNDRSPFLRSNNHHFFERGQCPFGFALMLPEFPSLRPMLQHGRQVVEEHVRHDFFEEGGYNEHSIRYLVAVLLCNVVPTYHLAQKNRTSLLTRKSKERVKRCFEMMASIVMPNGYFPDIGDEQGMCARTTLESGRDLFGSTTCGAVLKALKITHGKLVDKKALPLPAVCYPDAGYIVGRYGWSPKSNYFILSTNTRAYMGHDHHDMLSLIFSVKGETVIGEPAACLYQLTNTKEYQGSALRGYVYNMTSHNTVLAYGKPIQEDIFFSVNYGGYPPKVKILDFQPKKNYLYVSATHDGYTCCRHLRHILFVHKHGWLILDRILQGPATNPPQVLPHIQRWHFDAGVKVEQMDSHAVLARKGNAQLLCVWPRIGTGKINMELHKNTTIQVGPFREEEKLPWMVDASFEKTNQAWLPCVFLPIEEGVSKQLVEICRKQIFTEVFKRAIDPVKDTAAILTLTKE